MTKKWKKWNDETVKETHGDIYFYRKMYEGNHGEIFSRAKRLIEEGEIIDNITKGSMTAKNVQTPYVVANISKLICEIPAILVSRSMGSVTSSVKPSRFQDEEVTEETESLIDAPETEEIIGIQQRLVEEIEKNSRLEFEHWGNITQHQVDGGLVGCVFNDERGLRIDFKARDVYYPHEDGRGVDLAYNRVIGDNKYLHVYRERVEEGGLRTSNLLYAVTDAQDTEPLEEEETKELLGTDELETFYEGRTRPFIVYWPNEKTFMNPLGVSVLKNQDSKQDEINWTLTRNALTFERNGKPRLAVSKEVLQNLQDKAFDRYGNEDFIDHRDLEITTFDEQGKAMEVIQVDVTKIGDVQWVKDLMKIMLMETKTSEKAIDFYMDGGSGAAQSGVAKFYDLFLSLVKAEGLRDEYIYFLKQLFENALWLANKEDPAIIVEEPDIAIKEMIPIPRKERIEENSIAMDPDKKMQSLETSVRRANPNASEEWVQQEIERIEAEQTGDDSTSLIRGGQTLSNLLDNRDQELVDEETEEEEE